MLSQEKLVNLLTHNKIILLAAGGTAGHLFPAIALAETLSDITHYDIHLITDLRCQKYLTSDIPAKTHIVNLYLNFSGIINKLKIPFLILSAIIRAFIKIRHIKPNIVIGFGGYPSFPTMLVCRILRIDMILHEQNSYFGKVNQIFAYYAKYICLAYQNTTKFDNKYKDKTHLIGYVVRKKIQQAPKKTKFSNKTLHLFIFGGSQSAKIFTSLIPEAIVILIRKFPDTKLEIIQQAKENDHAKIINIYDSLGIKHKIAPFFYDMASIYKKSDLVISRSGASTIAELSTIGLPSIFIPFPTAADNHQYYNAKYLSDINASWYFKQAKITPLMLADKIHELYKNRTLLKSASKQLLKIKSDGSMQLSNIVLKHLEKK